VSEIKFNRSVTQADDVSLYYIDDLDSNNYSDYVSDFRENIKKLMRINSLNFSDVAQLVGVSRLTIKRFIANSNDKITYVTANKFNNLVYKIYKESNL